MNNKERFARIAAVTSIIGLSATASSCDWVDWNLKHERIVPQGTTVRVQPDQFIEGNVTLKSADGTWTTVLFDKDEKTGLIVNPEITSEVTFAEEGKIVRVTNLKNKDAEIEKEKQKMIKAKGYTKVDAITVDGGIQQMQGENLPGRSIDKGQTVDMNTDEIAIGDVTLVNKDGSETKLFDSLDSTGLLVDIQTPSKIYFENGGGIRTVTNLENKRQMLKNARLEMLSNGKERVDIITVDGKGKQQIQGQAQTEIKTDENNGAIIKIPEENLPSREIEMGQIVDVMPNEFISGDVLLVNPDGSRTKLCDSKDETGLIVDIRIPSKVEFKFGTGNIQPVVNLQNKAQMMENTRLAMLKAGKEKVDIITVDGIGAQKVQGQETSTTEEQINGPRVFSKGETAILEENDIVSADPSAIMNDGSTIKLCDDNGDTALIIINRKKDAKFIFDNGGSVLSLSDLSKREAEIEKIKMQKIAEGFKRVDVIEFTGQPDQEVQGK